MQNLRGGKVVLQSLVMPDIELSGTPQGDALYSMELALSLERLNNEKLLALHKVGAPFIPFHHMPSFTVSGL